MAYLEACISAAKAEADNLANHEIGELSGAGSLFKFRRLGRLGIGYAGVKIPSAPGVRAKDRLIGEVAQISLYTSLAPSLLSKVPTFMFLVCVEDTKEMGIITEDASNNGEKKLNPRPASRETRELLYRPFKELGDEKSVLDIDALDFATAFSADGEEQLLDFTPPPVAARILYPVGRGPLAPYYESTIEALGDLTVVVPSDSEFGQSLIAA